MFSSITPDQPAIRLQNISKVYKLHGSQRDQLIDVLGLQRFGLQTHHSAKEYAALRDISLDVPRGHRIGIVGRNGAGKTTLLKLLCGNFTPTTGSIEVNGTVQALMNIGLGFHPEYTGRENVAASLQYNGLARNDYQAAMESIIDFCELGDYLDQPFKTYSLGMQARLMFAAATAIKPDILIVDEMLGAGDAYFVAKSKSRVENLVGSGCTMILVSHSMQQILELCSEVIWLDQGSIRMRGDAFLVVKAYEEFLHGPIQQISAPLQKNASGNSRSEQAPDDVHPCAEKLLVSENLPAPIRRNHDFPDDILLQEPRFSPHDESPRFPDYSPEDVAGFQFQAPGGISRWTSERGLKICGFSILTERGITNTLISMRPAKFVVTFIAEESAKFNCRYGLVIFDHKGRSITKIVSPLDQFEINEGESRQFEIILNPNQLGPGEYILSISLHEYEPLEKFNSTTRFDLLTRSFVFRVELPSSLDAISTDFFHTAEWRFLP